MATREGTKIGGTLTLLLIFVITIVVIVVIFAYFDGLFRVVSGGTSTMTVSGVFILSANGGDKGNVTILVRDTSHTPIVSASLVCPSSEFVSAGCGTIVLTQNSLQVTAKNPLTYDETGTGSAILTSASGTTFSAGGVYTVTIDATFADGSIASEALVLPGQ